MPSQQHLLEAVCLEEPHQHQHQLQAVFLALSPLLGQQRLRANPRRLSLDNSQLRLQAQRVEECSVQSQLHQLVVSLVNPLAPHQHQAVSSERKLVQHLLHRQRRPEVSLVLLLHLQVLQLLQHPEVSLAPSQQNLQSRDSLSVPLRPPLNRE